MTVIADTSAMLALLDGNDEAHEAVAALFEEYGAEWLLPWAILPEVDYLAATRLGPHVAMAFFDDVVAGAFRVEGYVGRDARRAQHLLRRYRSLSLGLVDAVVMAQAERLEARAIVTLDRRHFGAVRLVGAPELWPQR